MKKIILFPLFLLLLSSAVSARGYMCGGGSGGFLIYKLLALIVGSFVFSVVFWWTYLWIVKDKGRLKKRK